MFRKFLEAIARVLRLKQLEEERDLSQPIYVASSGDLLEVLKLIPEDLPLVCNILTEDGKWLNQPVSIFYNENIQTCVLQTKPLKNIP